MKALTPYRHSDIEASKLNEPKKWADGALVRGDWEPPHECRKPGVFRRLFARIKRLDIWICKCGIAYQWHKYSRPEWYDLNHRERDDELKRLSYANPWKTFTPE